MFRSLRFVQRCLNPLARRSSTFWIISSWVRGHWVSAFVHDNGNIQRTPFWAIL
jgi:hypothetical protein